MDIRTMTLEELNALAASEHQKLQETHENLRRINDRRRYLESKLAAERLAQLTPEQQATRARNTRRIG